MAYSITAETAEEMLDRDGVVNIGQIGPELKRSLERRVRRGELRKYRGFWSTMSPDFGFGPLKTIYVRA